MKLPSDSLDYGCSGLMLDLEILYFHEIEKVKTK